MQRFGIGDMEMKMAKLLWDREGIGSGEVVKLCADEFGWKKSTTYTMLRRLTEHGLFQNKDSIVTSVISDEEYLTRVIDDLVEDKFDGSFATLVELYLDNRGLPKSEMNRLHNMIARKEGY